MTLTIELEGIDDSDIDQYDAERMSAVFRRIARQSLGHPVTAVDVHFNGAVIRDATQADVTQTAD